MTPPYDIKKISGRLEQSAAETFIVLSIVLWLELEVCLWMCTYGAHLGSHLAYMQVATVAALPYALLVTAEYHTVLNVLKKFLVTVLVNLLYS